MRTNGNSGRFSFFLLTNVAALYESKTTTLHRQQDQKIIFLPRSKHTGICPAKSHTWTAERGGKGFWPKERIDSLPLCFLCIFSPMRMTDILHVLTLSIYFNGPYVTLAAHTPPKNNYITTSSRYKYESMESNHDLRTEQTWCMELLDFLIPANKTVNTSRGHLTLLRLWLVFSLHGLVVQPDVTARSRNTDPHLTPQSLEDLDCSFSHMELRRLQSLVLLWMWPL